MEYNNIPSTVGSAGIVLNSKMNHSASRTVEFAGLKTLRNSIKALPQYLNAICFIPNPFWMLDSYEAMVCTDKSGR